MSETETGRQGILSSNLKSPKMAIAEDSAFLFYSSSMASLASHLSKKLKNFFLITLLTTAAVTSEQQCRNFKSIIIFGDSITDTGNLLHLSEPNNLPQSAFPPYGETFFHVPTGRFSNGRLIIDFIGKTYSFLRTL